MSITLLDCSPIFHGSVALCDEGVPWAVTRQCRDTSFSGKSGGAGGRFKRRFDGSYRPNALEKLKNTI